MKRIEYTGISGIGKTTLYKAVCSQRSSVDNWLTPSEVRLKIVKEKITGGFFINRSTLIKLNLFKRFHLQWINEIISRYKWEVYNNTLNENHNFWMNLLIEYYYNNMSQPPDAKLELMRRFMNEIEQIAYFEYFKINETIVWDEGLLKIIPNISNIDSFKTNINNKIDKSQLTDPAGVIYCTIDIEENFRRRKQRILQGKASQIERKLTDDELFKRCKEMNERHSKIMTESDIKFPLLNINLAENFDINVQQCLEFIRTINNTSFD